MRLVDGQELHQKITSANVIHVFGAGVNPEKPAHKAVHELSAEDGQPLLSTPKMLVLQSMVSRLDLLWIQELLQKLLSSSSHLSVREESLEI